MYWLLLAHLFIPLIFGAGFILLSYATGPEDALGSELMIEAALDVSILSLGATAAIVENPHVQTFFGQPENAAIAGVTMTALNFFFATIVLLFRRSIYKKTSSVKTKRTCAGFGFACSILALGCITLPVVLAFRPPSPTKVIDPMPAITRHPTG